MRPYYILATLVTSFALILTGCGDSKKEKSDAPLVQDKQPDSSKDPEEEEGDETTTVGTQPPATNPPVTNPPVTNPPVTNPPVTNPPVTNPPVTNPPVTNPPATTNFGQIVSADQDSIQTKLIDHYCVACHRGNSPKANLNLETLTPYLTGELGANGYRGALLFPGRGDISTLTLVMARHESYSAMPPAANALKIPAVTAQQITAVTAWIDSLKLAEKGSGGIGRN